MATTNASASYSAILEQAMNLKRAHDNLKSQTPEGLAAVANKRLKDLQDALATASTGDARLQEERDQAQVDAKRVADQLRTAIQDRDAMILRCPMATVNEEDVTADVLKNPSFEAPPTDDSARALPTDWSLVPGATPADSIGYVNLINGKSKAWGTPGAQNGAAVLGLQKTTRTGVMGVQQTVGPLQSDATYRLKFFSRMRPGLANDVVFEVLVDGVSVLRITYNNGFIANNIAWKEQVTKPWRVKEGSPAPTSAVVAFQVSSAMVNSTILIDHVRVFRLK